MSNHKNRLQILKQSGFQPINILDIGAYEGEWTRLAKEVFPVSHFTMIEANSDKVKILESVGETLITVLGEYDTGQVLYYKCKNGVPTGNGIYKENTSFEFDSELRYSKRLDSVVNKTYDLIKMDVQGAELDIIKGGLETVKKAEYLLLEMQTIEYNINAPMASDVIAYLQKHNFILCDIFDLMYDQKGKLIQLDALFRNGERHGAEGRNGNTKRSFTIKTEE